MNKTSAGIIGPYRFRNFGDDLIGLIIAHHLKSIGYKRVLMHGILPKNALLAKAEVENPLKIALNTDLTVFGGGHVLGDGSFSPNNYYQKLLAKYIFIRKVLFKKSVICGVGAGPLQLSSSYFYARIASSLSTRIGVRDKDSFEFVINALKQSPQKISEGSDLALLWPSIWPNLLNNRPRPRIGVQLDPSLSSDIPIEIVEILKNFLKNKEILYLSNGIYKTKAEGIINIKSQHTGYSDMEQFMNELSSCSLIITTHLHIAIAAYAARIPTITIAINEKTLRFYQQINHPYRCFLIKNLSNSDAKEIKHRLEHSVWNSSDDAQLRKLNESARKMLQNTLNIE